jgi:hypothetical protein
MRRKPLVPQGNDVATAPRVRRLAGMVRSPVCRPKLSPRPDRLIAIAANSEEPTDPATDLWPPDSPITSEMLDYYKVRAHLLRTQAFADMAASAFEWVASAVKRILRR